MLVTVVYYQIIIKDVFRISCILRTELKQNNIFVYDTYLKALCCMILQMDMCYKFAMVVNDMINCAVKFKLSMEETFYYIL